MIRNFPGNLLATLLVLTWTSAAGAIPIISENFQTTSFPGPNPGWTHDGQFGTLFGQGSLEDSTGGNNFIDINNSSNPGNGVSTFVGTGGPGSLAGFGAGTLTFSFDYSADNSNGSFTLSGPGIAVPFSTGLLASTGSAFDNYTNVVLASIPTTGAAPGGTYTFTFSGTRNFANSYDNFLLDFTPSGVAAVPEISLSSGLIPMFLCVTMLLVLGGQRRTAPIST